MDLGLGVGILVFLYILYVLFIRGALFKLILGVFGWFGMYWFLSDIPAFQNNVFVDSGSFTWAMMAPTILVVLVLLCTKEE